MASRLWPVSRSVTRCRFPGLASGGGGALYVDTLKSNRGRTVPLVQDLVPIVDRWSSGKPPDAWLFETPHGGASGRKYLVRVGVLVEPPIGIELMTYALRGGITGRSPSS